MSKLLLHSMLWYAHLFILLANSNIVRGVAAAKEVVVDRRRTRPDDPAEALLDAVRVPGVQRVSVCVAWSGKGERERLISISSWFIH